VCLDFSFGESEKYKKPQMIRCFSQSCGFLLYFIAPKRWCVLAADAPDKNFASRPVVHIFHRIGCLAEDHSFNAERINNAHPGANLTPYHAL
jgi:hypothetical protein